jgi:hypothetical protein
MAKTKVPRRGNSFDREEAEKMMDAVLKSALVMSPMPHAKPKKAAPKRRRRASAKA